MQIPVAVTVQFPSENLISDQTQIVKLVAVTWYLPDGVEAAVKEAEGVNKMADPEKGLRLEGPPQAKSTELVPVAPK